MSSSAIAQWSKPGVPIKSNPRIKRRAVLAREAMVFRTMKSGAFGRPEAHKFTYNVTTCL